MKLTEYRQELKQASKYRNRKTEVDGITFDSKREADYYRDLKLLQRAGEIQSIELQPRFLLIEPYEINGRKERATHYVADFIVTYADGRKEIIDVKSEGTRTAVYKLKKKLFERRYGIPIIEVC